MMAKQLFAKVTSGEPIAHLTKRKAEDFWPKTLDEEAMRAARILRSYFMDGFVVCVPGWSGNACD